MTNGFFSLQTPRDLFEKLKREYGRLVSRPTDSDVAWNLFVTADHLIDWLHPTSPDERTKIRRQTVIGRVCAPLRNTAKHFNSDPDRHASATHTDTVAGAF